MQKNLAVSSSPHLRAKTTTRGIMLDVIIALLPAGIASVVLYGAPALKLIFLATVTCVLAEWVYRRLTKQSNTVGDLSAVVTGLLLAYNLPADAPGWLAIIGSIIAIVLVKQIYGGLGSNFMNPALTARAILFISWSSLMTTYPAPAALDTVSGATPLVTLANGGMSELNLMDLLMGRCGGVLGETCKLAIILGGVYLIIRKVIDWRIPLLMIGTVFICYLLKDGAEMALFQILSGGLMLGAFFMATDYATSPITPRGRIIFAVLCGLVLFVIRAYANYPEGCSFAILFMNVVTPLIDHFTLPTPFGEVKKHG